MNMDKQTTKPIIKPKTKTKADRLADTLILVRLAPVTDQLEKLNSNVERLIGLYELQLQSVNHITTRIVQATPQELADTLVGYNDPELFDAIERMEIEGGRKLTDDELARVVKAWQEESDAAN